MVPASAPRFQRLAAVAALLAGRSSSIFASPFNLTVSGCADLAALPSTMTEDTNLFLERSRFRWDEVTTVTVNGRYQYKVTCDDNEAEFSNVRFAISGQATFSLSLGGEESARRAEFTGINAMDGGVIYVEKGSSAVFSVPVTFDSNSVFAQSSGGAVYAAGKVDFKHGTVFTENKVLRDGDTSGRFGGALCVASNGVVTFEQLASFKNNRAESGGDGGVVANFGYLAFKGGSLFSDNRASENFDGVGGDGGAILNQEGSTTGFKGRTVLQGSAGSKGGALYNKGTTILEGGAVFAENTAYGGDQGRGGHIYTDGYLSTAGEVTFLQGAADNGGALFVDYSGTFVSSDNVDYIVNTAREEFPDLFIRGQDPRCQETMASVTGSKLALDL